MTNRLTAQPGEIIDRSTSLSFTWNGKAIIGYQGDTIASAIAATGIDVFGRSIKYHRTQTGRAPRREAG